MARRKKGRAVHGWLIIDKPAGMTSTAVVNKARWSFGAAKAGHAGTLDPAATGLLAVAFGEATKTIPFIMDAEKAYRFTVRWGQATNTDDADGEITATSEVRPDQAAIEAALRDGEESDLAARPLHVAELALISQPDADHAEFEMVCGKGGYVRSIARDLGAMLGCHGHVTTLRRVWSGPFDLDQAVGMEALGETGGNAALDALLLPLESGLIDLPEQRIGQEGAAKIMNGNPGQIAATSLEYGDLCWVSHDGRAIAVGTYRAGTVAPSRVFVYGP